LLLLFCNTFFFFFFCFFFIERGRERTEQRLADRNERSEMYRLIDALRAARGLSAR